MLKDSNFDVPDKKFSIIIAFHDYGLHIKEAIESVIRQSIGFEDNVQLILIDCASGDDSFKIASDYEKKYPQNIVLASHELASIQGGRNLAMEYATGTYINFLDGRDKFHPDALAEIDAAFDKYTEDIICLPVSNFSNEFITPRSYAIKGIIDLNKNPKSNLKFTYSAFFRKEIIDDIDFDAGLIINDELTFINKALLKTKRYVLLDCEACYYFWERNLFEEDLKLKKEFYQSQIKYFLVELIDYCMDKYGEMDEFIKITVLEYLILLIKNTPIREVLSDTELEEFFDQIRYIVSKFSADEITDCLSNLSDSSYLISVKNKEITIKSTDTDILDIRKSDRTVEVYSNDYLIDDLSQRPIVLDFVTLRDDVLYFSGYVKSILDKDLICVKAIKDYNGKNTEIIDATFYDYPTRSSSYMMGLEWEETYNFDLEIPIKSAKERSGIKLITIYDDDIKIDSPIKFRKFCNMSYASHYYVKNNRIVMFDGKFNVMPYSYLKMIRYEIKGLFKVFKNREAFFEQAIFLRLMHLILYPFMKNREIWIVMDRKRAADDNAEHFYKYALKQDDGIKKFFTIIAGTPDFERLEKTYGNILPFESVKHRLYYAFADKVISSQGSEFYLNPFRNRGYHQTAGISNVDFYFLQHGIIKDNMSSWLRKYDRNPKLIVTSTQLEYESLFDEGYNYGDKVIQLLGLPRYDNLNNQGLKKQIVIMSSWRNFLTDEDDVLNSQYFKRFNSLVNNERLIEHARKKGYEIVFKPHPELVRYLYLFDKNDYVQIDADKKYQVLLNESSIFVTDYSSVFFDFSYLKKPLIYYQYANDYHYDSDNGYFQYETMGFGPVMRNEDDLVDKLIEYMDSGCEMEDIYKKRVDDFFKYHDRNNSKRCYDWIKSH